MTRKLRFSLLVLAAAALGCSSSPVQPSGPAPMAIVTLSDVLPGSGVVKHDVTMTAAGRGYFSVKSDAGFTVSLTPPTSEDRTTGSVYMFSADGNRRFLDVAKGQQIRVWIFSQATPPASGRYTMEAGVIPAAD